MKQKLNVKQPGGWPTILYLIESLKGYSDILFWKGPTLLKELRIVLEPEK